MQLGGAQGDLQGCRPVFSCPLRASAPLWSHFCSKLHGCFVLHCTTVPILSQTQLETEPV